MSKNVITIEKTKTVADVVALMDKYNIGCVIVAKDSRPEGILTERDIIRKIMAKKKDPANVKVSEVMSKDIKTIGPETSIIRAVKIMDENNFRHMIIVDAGKLVGILTAKDLIKMTSY